MISVWSLFWLLIVPIKIWVAFHILIWVYGLFFGIILIGLLSLIPITILGIGIREFSMVYLFELYGIGFDKAIAMALIILVIQLISTLPGIVLFSKNPFKISNIKQQSSLP